VLIGGIAFGLVLGLLSGGQLGKIATVRLRWAALIFLAVLVRYASEALIIRGFEPAISLRLPLLVGASAILLVALWPNRRLPGISIAFIGVLLNALVLSVNDGLMPVWLPSLTAAGFRPDDVSPDLHLILPATIDASFLAHLGPFADLLPIPIPLIANVDSIGDVLIAFGLAFFLFAIVQRAPALDDWATEPSGASAGSGSDESGQGGAERRDGRPELRPVVGLAGAARLSRANPAGPMLPAGTGLVPGLSEASRLDRPMLLGSSGLSMALPSVEEFPSQRAGLPSALADRARRNPYGRLALNGPFATLWTGGLFSLFGDRVNQVVLGFFILRETGSFVAVSFVFFAATVPNLVFGSLAGTFVDRANQKAVMVTSDFLRAGLVFLLPIAALVSPVLVYPLVFLVTTVSIFFRPAREAVIPRIVPANELMTANSATWLSETLADVVGYGLAGLLLFVMGTEYTLAFWFDAATYVVSGALITTIVVPPVVHRVSVSERTFRSDFVEGWRFLRNESVLFANTLQAIAGQMAIGSLLPLSVIYASTVINGGGLPGTTVYAFLEGAIGVGNLIGGVAIGLVGTRYGKGRLVIAGYTVAGACILLYSRTDLLPIAIGLMVGLGIANLVFVIPSQTLMQQRIPRDMMARVVSIRFSLVFGTMALATGVSGLLASVFGVADVIGAFGLLTCLAGLSGLFTPAVRDA
jgi:MFS transporter, DHA3 family, macrolide efflux protein